MTEDEAKTKWCPFVRHGSDPNEPASNRSGVGKVAPTWALCIGSACMAWRTRTEAVTGYDIHGDLVARPPVTVGYCGLAGAA